MTPEKPFSVLLADYLRAALVDYNNGSAEDTRNAEDACGLVLAEYARVVNDLSEDLHSAARCGQPGPHACPGCVIDGLREELDAANRRLVEAVHALTHAVDKLGMAKAVLREILSCSWESGYPGRAAVRTHWIDKERADGWGRVLVELDADPHPPAVSESGQ